MDKTCSGSIIVYNYKGSKYIRFTINQRDCCNEAVDIFFELPKEKATIFDSGLSNFFDENYNFLLNESNIVNNTNIISQLKNYSGNDRNSRTYQLFNKYIEKNKQVFGCEEQMLTAQPQMLAAQTQMLTVQPQMLEPQTSKLTAQPQMLAPQTSNLAAQTQMLAEQPQMLAKQPPNNNKPTWTPPKIAIPLIGLGKKGGKKTKRKRTRRKRQKGGKFNRKETAKIRKELKKFKFSKKEEDTLMTELNKTATELSKDDGDTQIVGQLNAIRKTKKDKEEKREDVRQFVASSVEEFGNQDRTNREYSSQGTISTSSQINH